MWILWGLILLWLGRRHPVIYDTSDLGRRRRILGIAAILMLALCFTRLPVR